MTRPKSIQDWARNFVRPDSPTFKRWVESLFVDPDAGDDFDGRGLHAVEIVVRPSRSSICIEKLARKVRRRWEQGRTSGRRSVFRGIETHPEFPVTILVDRPVRGRRTTTQIAVPVEIQEVENPPEHDFAALEADARRAYLEAIVSSVLAQRGLVRR